MADKYPNIPGIVVGIRDGSLRPEEAPAGPTVAVLGTAKKGASKTQVKVASGPSALSRFGLSGTLGRSLVEVFQGGGDNALAFRMLATKGKINNIGDVAGAAGYSIESVAEGSDALAKFSVLYDNEDDILKVFDVASGQVVYSNDPETPVDLGVVTVTGEKVVNNAYGSIGKAVKLRTDESAQVCELGDSADLAVLGFDANHNVGLLQFDDVTNPFKVQVLSALNDTAQYRTAVRLATAAALPAYARVGDVITASANGALSVDGVAVDAADRILVKDGADGSDNGIYTVTTVGDGGTPYVLTRATDMDVDAEFDSGCAVSVTAGTANSAKVFVLTTFAPITKNTTALVFADATTKASWMVERNLADVSTADREVTLDAVLSATYFPPGLDHKVRFLSAVNAARADKILFNRLFISNASGPSAGLQPLKVLPGSDFNGLPKAVNDSGWAVDVVDSEGVLNLEEVLPAKMNMYEGMEDAFLDLEAADFSVIVVPGVYANDPALDGQLTGATAAPSEIFASPTVATIAGFADRCKLTFPDGTRAARVTALETAGRGGVWAVFTSIQGTAENDVFGFGHTAGELVRTARILNWELVDDADDDTIIVHFDRDVSFSLVESTGAVDGDLAPVVDLYATDVLFYHRSAEVDGKLRHMWYPATSDADGYVYNEVNFAYSLARFCQSMTENEVAINGVIGVRPPSNHFSPAALAQWIGKSPLFFDGDVSTNGSGLLGNKFVAGMLMDDDSQFDPGYKATETGELDDDEILLDANSFEVDMGKFLSTVASWPILSNDADTSGLGYINSGAALYAGLLAGLPSWRGATAKFIGGRGIRLPMKLAKRHQDSLAKARYVVFDQRPEGVIVVDAPSSALPTSDFTRNMTVRLVSEAVKICRDVSRPFLGDPLSGIRKAGLETALKKGLSDLQRASGGALEAFTLSLTQTALDKIRGSAQLTLTLQIINELRKITIDVALTQ